jgi:hypothetical protein
MLQAIYAIGTTTGFLLFGFQTLPECAPIGQKTKDISNGFSRK